MFKRRDDFLMQMDVEVRTEAMATALAMAMAKVSERGLEISPAEMKAELVEKFNRLIQDAAKQALGTHGQKLKQSDAEPDDEAPRFSVLFQGEAAGALRAYEQWCTWVAGMGGTERIQTASLRGSEGTNLQYMDEELEKEYAEMFAALPKEAQAEIDVLMAP